MWRHCLGLYFTWRLISRDWHLFVLIDSSEESSPDEETHPSRIYVGSVWGFGAVLMMTSRVNADFEVKSCSPVVLASQTQPTV